MINTLNEFKRVHNLREGEIVLVQIQSSIFEADTKMGKSKKVQLPDRRIRKNSVTGQGIHTDGQTGGMIMVLERKNIAGAVNKFHHDLESNVESESCFFEKIINPGEIIYYKDNSIYHSVTEAYPEDSKKRSFRTVMLIHYPGSVLITGNKNPENTLKVNKVVEGKSLRKNVDYNAKNWGRRSTLVMLEQESLLQKKKFSIKNLNIFKYFGC